MAKSGYCDKCGAEIISPAQSRCTNCGYPVAKFPGNPGLLAPPVSVSVTTTDSIKLGDHLTPRWKIENTSGAPISQIEFLADHEWLDRSIKGKRRDLTRGSPWFLDGEFTPQKPGEHLTFKFLLHLSGGSGNDRVFRGDFEVHVTEKPPPAQIGTIIQGGSSTEYGQGHNAGGQGNEMTEEIRNQVVVGSPDDLKSSDRSPLEPISIPLTEVSIEDWDELSAEARNRPSSDPAPESHTPIPEPTVSAEKTAANSGTETGAMSAQSEKSKTPLAVGIFALILLIGIAAFFMAGRDKPPEPPPPPNLEPVKLTLDRSQYRTGDSQVVTAKVNQGGYLYIACLWADGSVYLYYPNVYGTDPRVEAGETILLPHEPEIYEITMEPTPGFPVAHESVVAILSPEPLPIPIPEMGEAGSVAETFRLLGSFTEEERKTIRTRGGVPRVLPGGIQIDRPGIQITTTPYEIVD